MATYVEGTGVTRDAEPVGLLTEGAAGIAVIALAIIALAGVSVDALASIATIVIGVGLMVQGFNTAGESSRVMVGTGAMAQAPEWSGEIVVDLIGGLAGIVLGILALVGVHAFYLMSAALIVFGAALLLSGAMAMQSRAMPVMAAGATQIVAYRGGSATGGMEVLVGIAAAVLGILSLVMAATVGGVLILVGFIAVGATLLTVSATFSTALLRMVTARTA